MKSNRLIKLLFIAIFLKSIVWSLLVPLWHTPDEQAHFAHVAYIAEGGDLTRHGKYPDMTEEILTSLDILGTKRDLQGNNKFTFHPEYRLPYSDTLNGPQEEEIKNLSTTTRKNFVIRESAYYPHFFYQISSQVYKLFYQSNLFIRVFTVRLLWILASLLMIWFSFKSAQIIFPKNPLYSVTITTMVAFHPMLSFVSTGVTSDNLHNLLFTAVIYFCLKIIQAPRWQSFLSLAVVLGIGMINKQQFFIAFPIILPVILFSLIKQPRKTLKSLTVLPLSLLLAFILAPNRITQLLNIFIKGGLPYLSLKSSTDQVIPGYQLLDHLVWTLKHTFREVIPWYWGVFNWLGVVLPKLVNQILNRLLILSSLGLFLKLFNSIKAKKITNSDKYLFFLAWAGLAYFASLTIWDWTFMRNNGFSFGIQGRYHFPVILPHMILLFVGCKELFSLFGKKIQQFSLTILSIGFIALNYLALHLIASSYYDLSSYKSFITQASQYKPFFAKGMWFSSVFALYIIFTLILIMSLIKILNKNNND
jgi:hypothetical protein